MSTNTLYKSASFLSLRTIDIRYKVTLSSWQIRNNFKIRYIDYCKKQVTRVCINSYVVLGDCGHDMFCGFRDLT